MDSGTRLDRPAHARGQYLIGSMVRAAPAPFPATLAEDIGGAAFECDLSDQIAREVCLTGYYEPPVSRLIQRRLSRGAVMVDVGANWGYFSLLAATSVGQAGSVIALEPDPRLFQRLASSVQQNVFTQVDVIQKAAGAETGNAMLRGYAEHSANRGLSRLARPGGFAPPDPPTPSLAGAPDAIFFRIECTTVDALTKDFACVDVVKVDVEGTELDVLRGMRVGLAEHRYRALVLELHPALIRERRETPDGCIQMLLAAGYRGWTIDESPSTYRRACNPRVPSQELVLPLEAWSAHAWPHVLWLAPGEELT